MIDLAQPSPSSKNYSSLRAILILASVIGLCVTTWDLTHALRDRSLLAELRFAEIFPPGSLEARRFKKLSLDLASDPASYSPVVRNQLATFLYDQTLQERRQRDFIQGMCGVLSHLRYALTVTPYDPELLMNWAALRQDIPESCGDKAKGHETIKKTIELVLNLAPHDPRGLYISAIAKINAGERNEGQRLVRKFLEQGSRPTDRQQREIIQLIKSPADLLILIPPDYEQVRVWSRPILSMHPFLEGGWSEALHNLQTEALRGAKIPSESEANERENFDKTLIELRRFAADGSVRQMIDRLLSTSPANSSEVNTWLARRASRTEVPVLRSYISEDQRPLKSSLSLWEQNPLIAFDSFYSSVGIFVPTDWEVSQIELAGTDTDKQTDAKFVRLYGSRDNHNWEDITKDTKMEIIHLRDSPILSLTLPTSSLKNSAKNSSYPYYKVHFGASLRTGALIGRLRSLAQVYGHHNG